MSDLKSINNDELDGFRKAYTPDIQNDDTSSLCSFGRISKQSDEVTQILKPSLENELKQLLKVTTDDHP